MDEWNDNATEYAADTDDEDDVTSSRTWSYQDDYREEVSEVSEILFLTERMTTLNEARAADIQCQITKIQTALEQTKTVVVDPPPLKRFHDESITHMVGAATNADWLSATFETGNTYTYHGDDTLTLQEVDAPLLDVYARIREAQKTCRAASDRYWELLEVFQDLLRKVMVLRGGLPYGQHFERPNVMAPPRATLEVGPYPMRGDAVAIPFTLTHSTSGKEMKSVLRVQLTDNAHAIVCISQGMRRYYISRKAMEKVYKEHTIFHRLTFLEEVCYLLQYMSHNRFTDRVVWIANVPFQWKGRKFLPA